MTRVLRLAGIVLLLSVYFSLAPFGYAAFAVLKLVPCRDKDARARKLQRIMRFAFGLMHDTVRVFRIFDFDHRTFLGQVPDGPCVIVANHPTLTDTSAMLASVEDLTTAVRRDVFRTFWVRPLLTEAAQLEGPSEDPASLQRLIDDATDRLARGFRVLLFPEGTRSPVVGMHRFGRAAFEIAVRANVPVVPVVIECTPRWLTRDSSFVRPPAGVPHLTMRALPSIHPSEAGSCSRTLRSMVVDAIRNELTPPTATGAGVNNRQYAAIT